MDTNDDGQASFTYEDNTLTFRLKPILSADMFDENNEVSFRLLGQCDVTYINSKRLPTFGENSVKISKYVLLNEHGNEIEVNEEAIKDDLAYDIREGLISKIKDIFILGEIVAIDYVSSHFVCGEY